jgi:uncharacterized protein
MAIYFADSSALLKRYRNETGSAHVLDVLESAERLFVSRLAAVEVSAALTRRAKTTKMPREDLIATLSLLDADLAGSIEITEVERRIMDQAVNVTRTHGLKGADSIQLASALFVRREVVRGEIILLSSDLELNASAMEEGMSVENPDLHP